MLEFRLARAELDSKQLEDIGAALSDLSGPIRVVQDQVLFTVPFSRNISFHGRGEYLDEIHKELNSSQNGLDSMLKFVALCGLGGTGKTQLALEYFYKFRSNYEACFWITCDTPVKASQGYVDIARRLKLGDCGHLQVQASVKDWLCESKIFPWKFSVVW